MDRKNKKVTSAWEDLFAELYGFVEDLYSDSKDSQDRKQPAEDYSEDETEHQVECPECNCDMECDHGYDCQCEAECRCRAESHPDNGEHKAKEASSHHIMRFRVSLYGSNGLTYPSSLGGTYLAIQEGDEDAICSEAVRCALDTLLKAFNEDEDRAYGVSVLVEDVSQASLRPDSRIFYYKEQTDGCDSDDKAKKALFDYFSVNLANLASDLSQMADLKCSISIGNLSLGYMTACIWGSPRYHSALKPMGQDGWDVAMQLAALVKERYDWRAQSSRS